MKPATFRYHAPKTLAEALTVLAEVAPEDGRVLAGGQSLVPIMAFRLAKPAHLVDINGIAELSRITVDGGALRIGALVRHTAFYAPVCDGPLGRLLATVVRSIAHHPVRTRGTFCGSVAHADPASEWCAVVATLDGEMVAQSKHGQRVIAAKDYFDGIMTTVLNDEELLTEVRLPLLSADTRVGFQEFSRRAGDFALSMAVTTYRLENGRIADPRVGIGGAEPFPRRIAEAEAVLNGQAPRPDLFQAAGEAAAAAIEPLEDIHTSADYRRDLVRAMTRRALDSAAR
jgi:carbon-monoxide dehydrogenase medium subunit